MIPMELEDYDHFKKRSLDNLVLQQAEDFGVSLEVARTGANKKYNDYLPEGLKTPGHYFYLLKDESMNSLGYLWFGEQAEFEKKKIFIYDIFVEGAQRGKGYGKWMMRWLEKETEQLNLSEIALHVLGYNHVARELYESIGFEITNVYMSKKI